MDHATFTNLVLQNPNNRAILSRLHELEVDDCWLVSGALFQAVWNRLTGRAPDYGIKDYDVFYFDASDLSWEAEDRIIQHAAALFEDLQIDVEVRNQARVHLWYEQRFGLPFPPLGTSCEGIDRFLARVSMAGMRPHADGFELYAPTGLKDVEEMVVRPNVTPNFDAGHYAAKAARWQACWPEVTIIEP